MIIILLGIKELINTFKGISFLTISLCNLLGEF